MGERKWRLWSLSLFLVEGHLGYERGHAKQSNKPLKGFKQESVIIQFTFLLFLFLYLKSLWLLHGKWTAREIKQVRGPSGNVDEAREPKHWETAGREPPGTADGTC